MNNEENAKTIEKTAQSNEYRIYKKRSQFASVVRRFRHNKSAMVGLIVFTIIALACLLADLYMDYNTMAIRQNIPDRLVSPNSTYLFGTDHYGRNLFARIVFGGRTSLGTALCVIIMATTIGSIVGSVAGYYGGLTDNVIMRINDVFFSIPYTLMAVCIVASLGGGMFNLGIACIVAVVPGNVRLFRAWVMPLKEQEFVEAARSYGTKDIRLLLHHIIPNTLGPIVVQATLHLAATVIAVSSLSYIGLGVKPPTPEWGAMLAEAKDYIRDYPHLVIIPGVAILVSTLSLNMIGDGLRDALDPKLKN